MRSFDSTACVIVKHANPCGVAIGDARCCAYQQAFKTDPTSAFGGIIAFNRPVDAATAEAVSGQFLMLLAPPYDGAALAILAAKKNVRVLEVPAGRARMPSTSSAWAAAGCVHQPGRLQLCRATR